MNLVAEKKDLLLSQGGESLEIKAKQSPVFSSALEKTKGEILSLIGTGPLKKTPSTSKKVENSITGERLKNLNKVNTMLKDAFEQTTKQDYTKAYQRLPDFMKTPIKEGYCKVLVSNVRKNEIVVCLGKMGNEQLKITIPEKNLIGKDYLRADEIVVQLSKKDGEICLKQVDDQWLELQDKKLLGRKLYYLPASGKDAVAGKIVDVSEYNGTKQVVFQPEKGGTSFALKLSTLLDGMAKAKSLYLEKSVTKTTPKTSN